MGHSHCIGQIQSLSAQDDLGTSLTKMLVMPSAPGIVEGRFFIFWFGQISGPSVYSVVFVSLNTLTSKVTSN